MSKSAISMNSCSICHSTFGHPSLLSMHQRSEGHSGYDFRCPIPSCSAFFATLDALETHQQCCDHYDNKSSECGACGREFPSTQECHTHVATKHGAFVCPVPSWAGRFRTPKGRGVHQSLEHHWYCRWPECRRVFQSKALLNAHRTKSAHIDPFLEARQTGQFKCSLFDCSRRFSTFLACLKHLQERHSYCKNCSKPFRYPRLLSEHLHKAEPHALEIRCQKCDSKFPKSSSLEQHEKKQKDICWERWMVAIDKAAPQVAVAEKRRDPCKNAAPRKMVIDIVVPEKYAAPHRRRLWNIDGNGKRRNAKFPKTGLHQPWISTATHSHQHTESPNHQSSQLSTTTPQEDAAPPVIMCSTCHLGFTWNLSLWRHKQAEEHMGGDDFRCRNCSIGFPGLDELKLHQRKMCHYGYGCPRCTDVFSTADERNSHTSAVHQVFSCPVWNCYMVNKTEAAVQRHQTWVYHWACNWRTCKRRFNSEDLLTAHKDAEKHHYLPTVPESMVKSEEPLAGHKSAATDHDDSAAPESTVQAPSVMVRRKKKKKLILLCPVIGCQERFWAIELQLSHLEEDHNYCFYCYKNFSTPELLLDHRFEAMNHFGEIKCPVCSETFSNLRIMNLHAGTCTSKPSKQERKKKRKKDKVSIITPKTPKTPKTPF